MCSEWYSVLMNRMNNKGIRILVFAIVLAIFTIIICVSIRKKTSKEYILKEILPKDAHILLEQESEVDNDVCHLLFVEADERFGVIILGKNIFGYKVVDMDNGLTIHDADENYDATSNFRYSSFQLSGREYYMCWGILTDNSISSVIQKDNKYIILPSGLDNIRICYILREGSLEDFPELEFIQ